MAPHNDQLTRVITHVPACLCSIHKWLPRACLAGCGKSLNRDDSPPQGLKSSLILHDLRGAKAPLYHSAAGFRDFFRSLLDVERIYPGHLVWGRSVVRLALAAFFFYLRPREAHWK